MDETETRSRPLPLGATWLGSDAGTHFRVWAPQRARVELQLESGPGAITPLPLERGGNGYHEATIPDLPPGSLYRYLLDGEGPLPDPASRFQPHGPHGPSQVIDPHSFRWTDHEWRGIDLHGQVLYEMHVGTFTDEGTWSAAAERLPDLVDLGITTVELMPVAEFPGRFGWGYDGVDLFAPYHQYGSPDEFRRFVDRAHALGLGVILDVVYNHLGPDGNYLGSYSPRYFSDAYGTEWGDALNFDGPDSEPVRAFFIENAERWISEYHLDGLRLDATQSVHDAARTTPHILEEITRAARAAAGDRSILVIAENEPQDATLVRPRARGGMGMDAIWNDDFHHAAIVALTGRTEAYYADYLGAPQEFVSSARWGFLYQGQHYVWQRKRRGAPAFDLPPAALVTYLQNHDQIANSGRGERIDRLASPARLRAMTTLLLLGPWTPMLFMGQELASPTPFLYFADHEGDLAAAVREGRREFLAQFPSLSSAEIPAPDDPETFRASRLIRDDSERARQALRLHRDLIRLRREDPVLSMRRDRGIDGAVLGANAFLLRYFGDREDRLLLVNPGREMNFSPAPEPLLAPGSSRGWTLRWSSEDPVYGGAGAPAPEQADGRWHLPAECAMLLAG